MDIIKFKPGDRAYTISGNEVVFITEHDGQALVQQVMQTDEEERFGKPFLIGEIFAEEPVQKWSAKIDKLNEEILELLKTRDALSAEIRAANATEKERKARLMQHRALTRIDDFLAGKMTHFVMESYRGVEVMTFDEVVRYKEDDYDRMPNGFRLLSLFGKTNGDLEWQISRYSDGSGSRDTVIPCLSHEEAIEQAKISIEKRFDTWRKNNNKNHFCSDAVSAEKLGLAVPEDITANNKRISLEGKQRQFDEAKKKFEQAQQELEEFNPS
jgi:hypothetical protein